jgi:hypothetical protein
MWIDFQLLYTFVTLQLDTPTAQAFSFHQLKLTQREVRTYLKGYEKEIIVCYVLYIV